MKKLLSFLMVLVAVFMVVGCGNTNTGNGDTPKEPEEIAVFDPSTEVTVKFWHAMGQANQKIIAEIITRFEKLYPNIKVEQTSLNDYTTLRDTISSGIAANELPTVAQTYPDHVALYLNGDAVRELDSYVSSEQEIQLADETTTIVGLTAEEQAQYVAGFWAEGTIYDSKGTRYSVPFNKSTEVMYYNKTMFDKYGWEVPKTWDQVVTICEEFKNTTEYATLSKDYKCAGFSYDSEANLFITLTQQWGGEYTKFDDNGKGVFAFNNDLSKEAIRFYSEQSAKGNLVTTTYFGTNYSSDAFKAGQVVMTIGSSAGASYNVPSDGSFEVGVTTYPQKDEKNNQVIQQGTNVSLFIRDDKQEELAGWLFMKFLTNYDSALLWCTETSYFPIRKDVLQSAEYQEHISGKIVDEQGQVVYKPTTQQLAQSVGLGQQNWFYTNVAFLGSSRARDNAQTIITNILYGGVSIEKAYNDAINDLMYN